MVAQESLLICTVPGRHYITLITSATISKKICLAGHCTGCMQYAPDAIPVHTAAKVRACQFDCLMYVCRPIHERPELCAVCLDPGGVWCNWQQGQCCYFRH